MDVCKGQIWFSFIQDRTDVHKFQLLTTANEYDRIGTLLRQQIMCTMIPDALFIR